MDYRAPQTTQSGQERAAHGAKVRPADFPVAKLSEIAAANIWYKRRSPFAFDAGGFSLRMAAEMSDGPAPREETAYLGLSIGALRAFMSMPARLIIKILESYGLPPRPMPAGRSLLLLLEHRFSQGLEALERHLKLPIALTDFSFQRPVEAKNLVGLDARCELWDDEYPVRLSVPPDLAAALGKLLDGSTTSQKSNPNVPITMAGRIAVTQLSLGALESIRLDDVILADSTAGAGMAFVIVGESFAARARWQGRSLTLLERPIKIANDHRGVWSMSDMANSGNEPEAVNAEFSDIQIKIVFELGRKEIRLGDLRSLAPGYVFDLSRDQRTAVDIYAGTRRVGFGEVVQINETLGVRVTRLFNNE